MSFCSFQRMFPVSGQVPELLHSEQGSYDVLEQVYRAAARRATRAGRLGYTDEQDSEDPVPGSSGLGGPHLWTPCHARSGMESNKTQVCISFSYSGPPFSTLHDDKTHRSCTQR